MNTHRYLRAYMAGIFVPTVVVAFALLAFVIARYMCQIPIPIERIVIFPMALAPSIFGLWNMFYARLSAGRHLPLGLHGALLPLILIPLGMAGATALQCLSFGRSGVVWFQAIAFPYMLLAPWIVVVMICYYLVWKYLVGFCNKVLGIA